MTEFRFRDFDINFIPHPISGDLATKVDVRSVQQSLRNLVSLRRGEKPFHPEIASGIADLLFEPASPITTIRLQQEIERVITSYEPRVVLNKVMVDLIDEQNSYDITIDYSIINEIQSVQLRVSLQRLR